MSCRLTKRLSTPLKTGPENLIMSISILRRSSPSIGLRIKTVGSLRQFQSVVDEVYSDKTNGRLLALAAQASSVSI